MTGIPISERSFGPAIAPAESVPRARDAGAPFPARQALATNALWLLASNIAYSGCQWGAVVVLAKIGAPNALGHLGLATAVATPVVVLTSMALRSYEATDVLRRYSFAEFLNLRFVAHLVAALVIGAVAASGMMPEAATAILVPLGIAKLADATSEVCYGLAQRHDGMRFVALSQAARAALGMGALIAVVALGGTLAAGTWALAAAWTAFLVAVDLPAARALEPMSAPPRAAALWSLTRECAPLGAMSGLIAVTQGVPRYFLQASHGAAAVGYFTALSAVGPLVGQFAAAIGQAAAPRLGWSAAGDGRGYRALVARLIGVAAVLSVVMTLGAAVTGRQLLTITYTAEYATYLTSFVLLVLAAGFSVVNGVAYFALLAARRRALLLVIQSAGLLATAAMGAWSVPRFGVDGAALAVTVGTAVVAAVNAGVLLRGGKAR